MSSTPGAWWVEVPTVLRGAELLAPAASDAEKLPMHGLPQWRLLGRHRNVTAWPPPQCPMRPRRGGGVRLRCGHRGVLPAATSSQRARASRVLSDRMAWRLPGRPGSLAADRLLSYFGSDHWPATRYDHLPFLLARFAKGPRARSRASPNLNPCRCRHNTESPRNDVPATAVTPTVTW